MRSWAGEQVGVITGTGTQELAPQCPAAACRFQSKDLKAPRNWEVPDGGTQEIMSQG